MFQSLSAVMNIYLHVCGCYAQNILSSRNTQTILLLFNILKTIKNYREGVVNIKYVSFPIQLVSEIFFTHIYIKQAALQIHAGLHIQWLLKKIKTGTPMQSFL
jgi:uncharacterized protein YbgA (DUF1722 family)